MATCWRSGLDAAPSGTFSISSSATLGSLGLPCLAVAWRTFSTTSGNGQVSWSRLAPLCNWSAQLLLASLVHAERLAALTGIRAAFIARMGGFELAIGGEQLAFDQGQTCGVAPPSRPWSCGSPRHRSGSGSDRGHPRRGHGVVQAGQFPVAMPLVRLVQIATEVGIINVLIHFGGHFQHDEARRIVAGAASGAIVGRTDRAGEAEVNGGPNEPTEAAFDLTLARGYDGPRRELIVRKPPAGALGKSVVKVSRYAD